MRVPRRNGTTCRQRKAHVFLWSGKWDASDSTATTNIEGQAELVGVQPDTYATIVAQADGMATTTQDLQLTIVEVRQLKFQLRRPVRSSVRILDSQANRSLVLYCRPLQFNAGDGGSFFHRHGSNDPFLFEPTTSDAQGVIHLPPMPRGPKSTWLSFIPVISLTGSTYLELSVRVN